MTTAAAKRKGTSRKGTAPRRAATRTNGAARSPQNGNGSAAAVPAEEFEARPPEQFVPTTRPVDGEGAPAAPAHPYGPGTPVYTFNPADGSAPIVFPHITAVRPTYHFMWKIRKMDQVHQSFEWMDLAGVPDPIQERVALLPDDEQGQFFLGWFSPVSEPQNAVTNGMAGPPGES